MNGWKRVQVCACRPLQSVCMQNRIFLSRILRLSNDSVWFFSLLDLDLNLSTCPPLLSFPPPSATLDAPASHNFCVDRPLTTSPSDPERAHVLWFSGDHHRCYSTGQLHYPRLHECPLTRTATHLQLNPDSQFYVSFSFFPPFFLLISCSRG